MIFFLLSPLWYTRSSAQMNCFLVALYGPWVSCFTPSLEYIQIPFCTNIMYAYHISYKLLFYLVLINDLYDDLCYKVFCCKRTEKCSEVTTGDVAFEVFF